MKFFKKIFFVFIIGGCANIVAPTGGNKDVDPPKLLNVSIIEKSKNSHEKIFAFKFNEYIQLNKWEEYFYISPPIKKRAQKKIKGATLFLTIDEEINDATNYYISLNSCIKDNNEGNVLTDLSYQFSKSINSDTLTLSGILQDSYTLNPLKNTWVMLFNEDLNDSLIFKTTPNYITKTDNDGSFLFPNLNKNNYKITAITSFDFIYNEEEKIAFSNNVISAEKDSFISLFAFDPIIKSDGIIQESTTLKSDSSINSEIDTIIQKQEFSYGKLKIIYPNNNNSIFQLLQDEKVILDTFFSKKPYIITNIFPGKYQLKHIADTNQDSVWNTGNWGQRTLPEKVVNYPSEITIRSNWDLELEWIIEE